MKVVCRACGHRIAVVEMVDGVMMWRRGPERIPLSEQGLRAKWARVDFPLVQPYATDNLGNKYLLDDELPSLCGNLVGGTVCGHNPAVRIGQVQQWLADTRASVRV